MGVYRPVDDQGSGGIAVPRYRPPMPVWPVIMDLPLMRGSEAPHAPHVAVAARPWPGAVAVYGSASEDSDFALNTTLPTGAMIGLTETPLARAAPGLLDRGAELLVRFGGGTLASSTPAALLQGANLVAIGSGEPDRWEVFQFARADLIEENLWSLRERLRGQFGTDAMMPDHWPVGAMVVVLDEALRPLSLDPAALGQQRFWRIGPATRGVDDPSYGLHVTETRGAGLRPLSPCHLRLSGDRLSWTRRTRLSGDRWDLRDVPLAEAREAYLIRLEAGLEAREFQTGTPALTLPSEWAGRAGQGGLRVSVAQISDEYGPGPFTTRSF
ncbi:MAG: hypothetical protein Q4G26_11485 [Paracoccus sp. (in: a-proteobacteria)]|nr:hypothetical protein [Paracoccus sp. (in: a-proteobacteria)]